MIDAYEITIRDFRIALRHTEWWEFKRRRYLQKQIAHYEGLLRLLTEKNSI